MDELNRVVERLVAWRPLVHRAGWRDARGGIMQLQAGHMPFGLAFSRIWDIAPTRACVFPCFLLPRCLHGCRNTCFEACQKWFENNPKIIYAKWQSEDGGRFHLKSNYNMIVEIKEDVELKIPDSFIWVTLYQIKQLMKIENFIGPHVRGIISYL